MCSDIRYIKIKQILIENNKNIFNDILVTGSWSTADKKLLLVLLQEYGASNLETIQAKMPHKSISEIRNICQKHTGLAVNKWLNEKPKKKGKHDNVREWLNILKAFTCHRIGPVHDIIPRVLKYIALYERRTDNTHINLRDCYLVLSDISNGLASKKLDGTSQYFLFQCLTKLAEALKTGETGSYKNHLKSLDNFDVLCKKQTRAKIEQDVLNPLNVPNHLLIMTDLDKSFNVFEGTSNINADDFLHIEPDT